MARPQQIAPGLFHWTAKHPEIGLRVSSYYLVPERVLLDPLLPSPKGLEWLERQGPPEHILLTNRLHERHSAKLVAAFGCTVWCPRAGLSDLNPAVKARPYKAGDSLPGGGRVLEIGVLCPDESALLFPRVKAAAVADGVIREDTGPLTFVPDDLLADEPADALLVKQGLRTAYRRLAAEDFEHLLLAHGDPWLHDGRTALRAWTMAKIE